MHSVVEFGFGFSGAVTWTTLILGIGWIIVTALADKIGEKALMVGQGMEQA